MKTKEVLLEQFTACFDQNDWFVALKNTLTHVTAKQAIWKPETSDNSIWGILSHLNFYNEAYLMRFKGIDYVYPTSDNSETFSISEGPSEADWESELTRFDSIMTEWSNLLAIADEIKFDQPVSKTNDSFWFQ